MPTTTTARLALCCVVRTTFSPGDKSDQRTWPVSPVSEIDFLCGFGGGLLVDVCVAWTLHVLDKALRPSCARRLDAGWMRGRRRVGRSRAIASAGLYTAAIVGIVLIVY